MPAMCKSWPLFCKLHNMIQWNVGKVGHFPNTKQEDNYNVYTHYYFVYVSTLLTQSHCSSSCSSSGTSCWELHACQSNSCRSAAPNAAGSESHDWEEAPLTVLTRPPLRLPTTDQSESGAGTAAVSLIVLRRLCGTGDSVVCWVRRAESGLALNSFFVWA